MNKQVSIYNMNCAGILFIYDTYILFKKFFLSESSQFLLDCCIYNTLLSLFSLKLLNVQPIATMSSVGMPALPRVLTLMLPPNANAPVCRHAPVTKAMF